MTLNELNNTIEALERSSLTFNNCQKLASLYICRDHFTEATKKPQNEDAGQKFKDFIAM